MVEAFAPKESVDLQRYEPVLRHDDPKAEVASDAWTAEVCDPFNARYGFY